jgi:hypothetical protein
MATSKRSQVVSPHVAVMFLTALGVGADWGGAIAIVWRAMVMTAKESKTMDVVGGSGMHTGETVAAAPR